MNRLSLRNNRLKFKSSGCLLIVIEDFYGICLKLMKKNRKNMSTCDRLDLETLESPPVMLKILPRHLWWTDLYAVESGGVCVCWGKCPGSFWA